MFHFVRTVLVCFLCVSPRQSRGYDTSPITRRKSYDRSYRYMHTCSEVASVIMSLRYFSHTCFFFSTISQAYWWLHTPFLPSPEDQEWPQRVLEAHQQPKSRLCSGQVSTIKYFYFFSSHNLRLLLTASYFFLFFFTSSLWYNGPVGCLKFRSLEKKGPSSVVLCSLSVCNVQWVYLHINLIVQPRALQGGINANLQGTSATDSCVSYDQEALTMCSTSAG